MTQPKPTVIGVARLHASFGGTIFTAKLDFVAVAFSCSGTLALELRADMFQLVLILNIFNSLDYTCSERRKEVVLNVPFNNVLHGVNQG